MRDNGPIPKMHRLNPETALEEADRLPRAVHMSFASISPAGETARVTRAVAEEVPIAVEVNGHGYAVLMATPANLIDLAYGFALSERLIQSREDVLDVVEHATEQGIILRLFLVERLSDAVIERVRRRVSDSSCGLCGIENLEQAMRPLPQLPHREPPPRESVFRALAQLHDHQPLNRATGAAHCAAFCDGSGAIQIAREDVGRHNAFDKLIGAMVRSDTAWVNGFALLSSRCSYELVEKAVLSGCPFLATISAPSSLAIVRAKEAGLALAVVARPDAYLSPCSGEGAAISNPGQEL